LDAAIKMPVLRLLTERPALRSFVVIRCSDELATQMLNVAIGWYVYVTTGDPMSLAYVGLAQFLPGIVVVLFAGHAADRYDRRSIIRLVLFIQTISLTAFGLWLAASDPSGGLIYVLLFLIAATRAMASPSMSAILPHVVKTDEFPRAVAITSSAHQICTILGPAIGGVLYAIIGPYVFFLAAALYFLAFTQGRNLVHDTRAAGEPASNLTDEGILAGIRYIRSNRLLLALISLDLFAVLLGGVTALLPIYAKDILAVGPIGLGALRCAPGIGAAIIGLFLTHHAIERGVGKLMLTCVAGYGGATIVFALSTNLWLSTVALMAVGGFDMVSVVIRQTLVQLSTPDAMRGRVSAVNWVFIGASSKLGEFESGLTAALFGTVPAALLGGLGTLVVVGLWTRLFPELGRADRLTTVEKSSTDGG
jgi:MFS family permease